MGERTVHWVNWVGKDEGKGPKPGEESGESRNDPGNNMIGRPLGE